MTSDSFSNDTLESCGSGSAWTGSGRAEAMLVAIRTSRTQAHANRRIVMGVSPQREGEGSGFRRQCTAGNGKVNASNFGVKSLYFGASIQLKLFSACSVI